MDETQSKLNSIILEIVTSKWASHPRDRGEQQNAYTSRIIALGAEVVPLLDKIQSKYDMLAQIIDSAKTQLNAPV